jgi:hypothetical protein
MKNVANVIKYIMIFLLAVSIIGIVMVNLISSTLLKEQYVVSKLEETNYYEKLKQEIEDSFENYIGQSGLDETVIHDIISVEKVKQDTKTILDNIYFGENKTVDATELETNLRKNINESLENRKLTITQQKAVDEYINKITTEYKQTLTHTKYETQIHQVISKVNQGIDILQKVILIVLGISVILILVLNAKQMLKSINHIGIALATSGGFFTVLGMYITSKIKIDNIVVQTEAISDVIKAVMNHLMNTIDQYGYLLLIAGIVFITIGNFFVYQKELKKKN